MHDRNFLISLAVSLLALVVSFVLNSYAVLYATASASGSVTDLILSNTRVYDVDGLFVYGAMALVLFIIVVCVREPERIPFTVKTISLFVIIRSVFIILTHLGPFPTQVVIDPSTQNFIQDIIGTHLFASFFLGKDSFFSGHTGLPFLMAFIYWDEKLLRWVFIVLSIFFGVVVLLGHLHYTIDVLSAFFISYGTYRIARIFFKTDMVHKQAENPV